MLVMGFMLESMAYIYIKKHRINALKYVVVFGSMSEGGGGGGGGGDMVVQRCPKCSSLGL